MIATRQAGLDRLQAFLPRASAHYAKERNSDMGADERSNVSQLSAYLRYRLLSEREVIEAVLSQHSLAAAEKYVQEVVWRTYWKGWLEQRPAVWQHFEDERDQQRNGFKNQRALAHAESGTTGIEGFDDWARELVATGYLHNHARMWFASIWIFTLRLPWTLGADFFLRYLIDADAASNTLSWRWVAGLQTIGKTYLATTENISRYTTGRFAPKGLALQAHAPSAPPLPLPLRLNDAQTNNNGEPALLLVTPEDMSPETFIARSAGIRKVIIVADATLFWGEAAHAFVNQAASDTAQRLASYYDCPAEIWPDLDADKLLVAAQSAKVDQIITPYTPVGLVACKLQNVTASLAKNTVTVTQVRRSWDSRFWPHAQKGFFPFREKIAQVLIKEGLTV